LRRVGAELVGELVEEGTLVLEGAPFLPWSSFLLNPINIIIKTLKYNIKNPYLNILLGGRSRTEGIENNKRRQVKLKILKTNLNRISII